MFSPQSLLSYECNRLRIMFFSWQKMGRFETTPLDITGNASGGLLSGRMVAKRVLQTFATLFQSTIWSLEDDMFFHLWSQMDASILTSIPLIATCQIDAWFQVIPGSVAQKEGFWTKNKADALQAGETSDRDGETWPTDAQETMMFFYEDYISISWTFWGSWFWDTLIFECDLIVAFYRCLCIFSLFYWYWCWSLIHEPEFQCPNTSVAIPSCISNTRMRWMPFSTRLVTQRLVGSCVTVTMARLGNLSWAWLSPSPSQHLGRTWDNIAGERKKDNGDYDQKVQTHFDNNFF